MSRTALVTDSTASLPPEVAEAHGITVVPLQVVIGKQAYDEGGPDGASAGTVASALREGTPVSTSRPGPARMLEAYERAAAGGASEVVSVHVSSELSGTYESAQLAAKQAPLPVTTIDSRTLGLATGFAVLAAAEVLAAGGSAADAAETARRRAGSSTSLFYVDTLEYLRRGGRIGAAAALLGSALAVKPLLTIESGRVGMKEKVRTAGRALSRLEELAVTAATGEVDLAVEHLANPERAELLAESLRARLKEQLSGRDVVVGEVGAVIGAHVGPGMVAVVVSPREPA
jgi:DegV family protein with EDD domain